MFYKAFAFFIADKACYIKRCLISVLVAFGGGVQKVFHRLWRRKKILNERRGCVKSPRLFI